MALPEMEEFDIRWCEYSPDDILQSGNRNCSQNAGEAFKPHQLLKLTSLESPDLLALIYKDDQLVEKAMVDVEVNNEICRICNKELKSVTDLRHHLISRQHIERIEIVNHGLRELGFKK